MNSFESDLVRAILSGGFIVGVIIELVILLANHDPKAPQAALESEIFYMSIPLICALPYSCGWLNEYQHGFSKFALVRSSFAGYICGKFFAAGISGGLAEVSGVWIYAKLTGCEEAPVSYGLLFLAAFLWAVTAATLASASKSKYLAYGGAFVLYYFLVILHKRYFEKLYCLDPYEWTKPSHTWIFDETGVGMLLVGMIILMAFLYYSVVRRMMERV